jgi:hypothetical protein
MKIIQELNCTDHAASQLRSHHATAGSTPSIDPSLYQPVFLHALHGIVFSDTHQKFIYKLRVHS